MSYGPIRALAMIVGPLLGALVALLLAQAGYSREIAVTGLVAAWCVIWWKVITNRSMS